MRSGRTFVAGCFAVAAILAATGCPGGSGDGADTGGPGTDSGDIGGSGDQGGNDNGTPDVPLPAHCSNGFTDSDETDKDCGGSCEGCSYQLKCKVSGDCASEWCAAGLCSVSTCKDSLQGPTETDIDCGGTCSPCAEDRKCVVLGDCASGKCVFGICGKATCDDLLQNGTESDKDCGGDCLPCGNGRTCNRPGDCASRQCVSHYCQACSQAAECPGNDDPCRTRTCTAGVCDFESIAAGQPASNQAIGDCKKVTCGADQSTTEENDDTDIPDDKNDCTTDGCDAGVPTHVQVETGSPCNSGIGRFCDDTGKCQQCLVDEDCPALVCSGNRCSAATCKDLTQNGDETGVDCGGRCGKCPAGQGCKGDADCLSSKCDGTVCLDAECDDRVQNGFETDQDCGGTKCPACGVGLSCKLDRDCTSGRCSDLQCIQCLLPTDCPAGTDLCKVPACETDLTCGFGNADIGFVPPTQPTGDCKKILCDGQGGQLPVIDDTDLPVDGTACTYDLCTSSVPSNPPAPPGTPCTENGGTKCNSDGECVP